MERDPLIPGQHDSPNTHDPVTISERSRDISDLEASCFPRRHSATHVGEGRPEERLEKVRLQATSLCLFDPLTDGLHIGCCERLPVQGAFGQEGVQPRANGGVDDLVQTGTNFGLVSIPDGLNQETPQGVVLEGIP